MGVTMPALCKRLIIAGALLLAIGGLLVALPSFAAADATPADPTPAPTPTLTLTAVPTVITAGTQATLTADLGIPLAALQLSAMAAGESAFTPLASLTTGADGSVSYPVRPARTTTYSVAFAGDADWAAASAQAIVAVRPLMKLSATAAVYEGQNVVFRVQVSPAHPGATIALELKQKDGWTQWRSLTLDAASKASWSWRSTAQGRFSFRAWMAADSGYAAGTSPGRSVLVKNPNPFHVPKGPAHYIVVDISHYLLYYHEHGRIVRVFKCVTGRPSLPTPLGHFRIYAKDPHTSGPYGPRRMRYKHLYAIHGTNEPWLLKRFPRNYSHGCTRLADTDIVWLYARCPVGTPVWNVR